MLDVEMSGYSCLYVAIFLGSNVDLWFLLIHFSVTVMLFWDPFNNSDNLMAFVCLSMELVYPFMSFLMFQLEV